MRYIIVFARKIIIAIRDLGQVIGWYLEFYRISHHRPVNKISNIMTLGLKRVLVLSPHADDEWIGCYGLLTSESISADVLYYQFYGYDHSESNKQIRDAEIKRCASKNGFHLYMLNELVNHSLVDILSENRYDALLCPSPYDWHWQHRLVFESLYNEVMELNARQAFIPRLLYYSISVPQVVSDNTYAFFMTKKQQDEKWAFFENNYVSQRMPVCRYKLQERLNTVGLSYSGDLYTTKDVDELKLDYAKISDPSFMSDLDLLKNTINSVRKIREMAFD